MTRLILALSAIVLPSLAAAETCIPARDIVPLLKNNFGETLSFVQTLPNQNVLEVFANRQTASWTVAVLVPTTKISCVIATGTGSAPSTEELDALTIL